MGKNTAHISKSSIHHILIGCGVILMALGIWATQTASTHLPTISQPVFAFDKAVLKTTKVETPEITGTPTRLVIEELGIDLGVEPGVYSSVTGDWTLSENSAHYAVISSPLSNKSGNTYLYGHNNKLVFAKLADAKRGMQAKVYSDNGHIFYYSLSEAHETTPADMDVMQWSEKPVLTIQTCSGVWYQNRHIFTFNLTGIE